MLFEASKSEVKLLVGIFIAEEVQTTLKDIPRLIDVTSLLLESGQSKPILGLGVNLDEALIQASSSIDLFVSKLELYVRVPGLLVRLPLHPALEDLSATRDVAEHLLHVGVLVPELIRSW